MEYFRYVWYIFYGLAILLILIYLSEQNLVNLGFFEFFTFYRCQDRQIGKITGEIFEENQISQNDSPRHADIYVPCGYNQVENELTYIDFHDKSQKYVFGINGCDRLVSKNNLWFLLESCYQRDGAAKIMPETYILDDSAHMKMIKSRFKQGSDILILKKNVQRKEGLKLTNKLSEVDQGSAQGYKVAQKYMRDVFLVNQRKVNLRLYYLVVIKGSEKKFYLSTLGKCIYTKKEYNDNDFDFETNITSYHLDMDVYQTNPRDFNQLRSYLDKSSAGRSDHLFDDITQKFKLLSRCVASDVYQSQNIQGTTSFQLFGVDVIFDQDLNSYILEINKGPDMVPRDEVDHQMKKQVQKDMFAIIGVIPQHDGNSFQLIHSTK